MIIPAVVRLDDRMDKLKRSLYCNCCGEKLEKGELVFYSKSAGHKYWHTKPLESGVECYKTAWKAPGTPYDIRQKMAIGYSVAKKTETNPELETIPETTDPRRL